MGEQELLSFEDDTILDTAEKLQAEEEKKSGKPKSKTTKKKPSNKKESSTESAGDESTDRQGDSKSESGTTDEQSKQTKKPKKNSSSTEPEVRADGWSVECIGTAPKLVKPNPYFKGVLACDGLSGEVSQASFKDINHATRVVYVDDIHLENPTVIDTKFLISGDFYDVVAHVTEGVFEEIRKDKRIKLRSIHYSYVSCEKPPRKRRNYQLINEDRWPTKEEIADMDKHFDSVDYALMGYAERQRYKESKARDGESTDELEKQERDEAESDNQAEIESA